MRYYMRYYMRYLVSQCKKKKTRGKKNKNQSNKTKAEGRVTDDMSDGGWAGHGS